MKIRIVVLGSVIAATGLSLSASAIADPDVDIGPYLPGQYMNVVETQPCDNWERWTYGLSPSGEFMACVSFDGGKTGMWSKSAPVAGIRQIGAPCSQANGDNLAQAPDGRPLLCDGVWLALPYGNLG